MAFQIRIPTEDEFEYPAHIARGSPTETSYEWESVLYEMWCPRQIVKYILSQLERLRAELQFCIRTRQPTDENEFKSRRDMICRAIRHIKPYLKENAVYRCRILDRVEAVQFGSVEYKKLFSI